MRNVRFAAPLFVLMVVSVGACALSRSPLRNPSQTELFAAAPDSFRVAIETNRGPVTMMAYRDWAPRGVDRFYFLVSHGYYDGVRFFRVLPHFVAQFGIHGDPEVSSAWRGRVIADDTVRQSNRRGTVSFASAGPNTRTVQLFINLADNTRLDTLGVGFPPIGRVISGMDIADSLYSGYGEGAPRGKGPSQDSIGVGGNEYLERAFPQLDYIVTARVERAWP